jgi:hypothetical protein
MPLLSLCPMPFVDTTRSGPKLLQFLKYQLVFNDPMGASIRGVQVLNVYQWCGGVVMIQRSLPSFFARYINCVQVRYCLSSHRPPMTYKKPHACSQGGCGKPVHERSGVDVNGVFSGHDSARSVRRARSSRIKCVHTRSWPVGLDSFELIVHRFKEWCWGQANCRQDSTEEGYCGCPGANWHFVAIVIEPEPRNLNDYLKDGGLFSTSNCLGQSKECVSR